MRVDARLRKERMAVGQIADRPRVSLRAADRSDTSDIPLKRLFDVTAAVLALSLLLPLILFIWLLVIGTSSGPALHMSSRVGRYGRLFTMPKFRTMELGSRACAREVLERSEEQITPLGRILRRTGLDELPQLACVLSGEMSFIGPRPLLADDPAIRERAKFPRTLSMRPGISGLAQVSGRNMVSPRRKARLDALYARTASFGLDMALLARTVVVIVSGKGFL